MNKDLINYYNKKANEYENLLNEIIDNNKISKSIKIYIMQMIMELKLKILTLKIKGSDNIKNHTFSKILYEYLKNNNMLDEYTRLLVHKLNYFEKINGKYRYEVLDEEIDENVYKMLYCDYKLIDEYLNVLLKNL